MTPSPPRSELHWCLHGPRLLAHSGLPELRLASDADADLDLSDWPALPRRLGLRFERIWAWALHRLPGWQCLAEEVQVRDGKRTLGGLDLLARHHDRVLHLELAVKFYLCRRGASGERRSDWVGPNVRDRLDLKLGRMRSHQLAMGSRPPTHATLLALGLPLPDTSLAVLRGVCFSDWRSPETGGAGRWCTVDELEDTVPQAHVLKRTEWLGGHGDLQLRQGLRLKEAVLRQLPRGAVQLVDPQGQRVMVVPTAWTDPLPHDLVPAS